MGQVQNVIDRNRRLGGWLIFSTHDIEERPSRFGCTPKFFEDVVRSAVDSGATILPVAAALQHIRGPNNQPHPEPVAS